jgi:glycosyltransferase involved in cell wall biosynthesis
MKIALVGSRGIPASYSGFETFYEQLGVRLAARGHQVTVYNRSHCIEYGDREYKGVRLVKMPSIRSKHLDTITHTALSLLHGIFCGYDIVYVCIVGNSPLCIFPKLMRVPVVINVDGDDADREKWQGFAKKYLRWTEKVACRLADVIIADAEVIQRRYLEVYGKETVFIPYGSNVWPRENEAGKNEVLKRFGLDSDGYILYVSRLTPENRADLAIEAFRRSRSGLKLVIVGDAPYVNDFTQKIRDLCDGERVIGTGYLFGEDYRQISCHARFFILPSGIDGTRPVLLDQMGFGNCVVVRNTAANMEVIQDAGISFDATRDIEALSEVITHLSQNSETVEQYRHKAIARVQKAYSWEAVTDRYEALFQNLAT